MIDEATLSDLLRDAAEAIEVPARGAERVLAARHTAAHGLDPSARRRLRTGHPSTTHATGGGRKRAVGAVAAALVLFIAVALAASHHSSGASNNASSGELDHRAAGAPARTPSTPGAAGAGVARSPSAGAGSVTLAPPSAASASPTSVPEAVPATVPSSPQVAPLPTQVIKTGALSLVVKTGQVGSTVERLTALAAGLGGYVQNSQTATTGNSPTATVTLRVPVANFTSLVTQAQAMGKVITITTSGQDVTAQSVDLAAQIQALQASRDQFLQILTKAQTIGDILSVEQQISGLQTQISQLQGQQKVLDSQTSYSTLTVSVAQPAATLVVPPPPHQPNGLSAAWAHARRSFTHGLESVVSASGGLAVFFICAGALVLIGWLGWRVARRRLV